MNISMTILTEKGDIMALEETVLDGENMTNLLKANWDISCTSYRKLAIGTANCFTVNDGSNTYFLKEYQSYIEDCDIIREAKILEKLKNCGIPSTDFIETVSGEKMVKYKGHRFVLQKYMSGQSYGYNDFPEEMLPQMAVMLAKIHIALKDMGIKRPYPLEGGVDNEERSASRKRVDNRMQEFVWAFGSETEDQIEKQITRQIEQLKQNGNVENLLHGRWSHMEAFDEDEWLEHLEEHLKEIVNISGKDERTLAARFEEHRREIHERIMKEHPELAQRFKERRHRLDEHLKERRPEVYDLVVSFREMENKKDLE